MDTVRQNPHLAAQIGAGIVSKRLQRHGHQGHRHLLAGGQQHVHFPSPGRRGYLTGQAGQSIGGVPHGGDHHHDLAALCQGAGHDPGSSPKMVHRSDGGPAEFLYDEPQGAA